MLIQRQIIRAIHDELLKEKSRIIVIYGSRQVGKTTLVNTVLESYPEKKIVSINGDDENSYKAISSRSLRDLESMVHGFDILYIDEAQRIPEIGINLKILYDHIKSLKIIVTGSSALDLASQTKEALTGRKAQFTLYPISLGELHQTHHRHYVESQIKERMIFGSYPQVVNIVNRDERARYVQDLAQDYLYKDVLELENVRYHRKIRDLLRLLAFQIGSEVSFNELGMSLGLGRETVMRYVDLLEKSFVIFTLRGFSRNLKKEVNKMPKIYFYDLGVRHALIKNFNPLEERDDVGALWENFLMSERMKRNAYTDHFCSPYFWRTYTGAALDYVEEYGGKLYGYEFKWKKTGKAPKTWLETYNGEFECINQDNFLDFVL